MPGIKEISTNKKNTLKEELFGEELVKSIDKHLYVAPGESRKGTFYPSALGNSCDRALFLSYHVGLPSSEISPQLNRIFDHGNATQSRYKKYFSKLGYLVDEEVVVKHQFPPISGRADFLLNINGSIYVVELKTINKDGFSGLSGPKSDHATQLQIYLNMLDIKQGGVLYECKDNQDIKIFDLKQSKSAWKNILKRCEKIINMGIMPRLHEVEGIHDRYCPCLLVKDES